MENTASYYGSVRRTDLRFRADYPDVQTTIYNINGEEFVIKCDNLEGDFEIIKGIFHNSIRPITLPISLSLDTPKEFVDVIPNMSDKDISKNFEGLLFNKAGFLNLLMLKFPNIHFYKIEENDSGEVIIYTASFEEKNGGTTNYVFLSNSDRQKVEDFLINLKVRVQFKVVDEQVDQPPTLSAPEHLNSMRFIYATSLRREAASEFSLRDEALWFDNVDNIFQGTFKKEDLYFYDREEYSCYVDFSVFENIDIRNHLFLFQTVYVSLPIDKSINEWLKESKIQRNEFLELASKNRIKIALTQPEARYDIKFIRDVYEANPNAVISKRALAALMQIDIVEMAEGYLFNDGEIASELKAVCQLVAQHLKSNPKYLYDFLMWPIRARRNSFEVLNSGGLVGASSFGVNTLMEKGVSKSSNRDISFEFTVNAPSIHLANSLNATYFPFQAKDGGYTDLHYASVMGEVLNFFKSANSKNIRSFIDNKVHINSGILPISPIDVIEVNDYVPITEFEDVLGRDVVYPKSKKLIETIAVLSDEERKKKIAEYNSAVSKLVNKNASRGDAIDLGQNIIMDAAGAYTGINIIGSAFSLLTIGGKRMMKSVPMIRNIASKIEDALYSDTDKENIHYLTKINRVARVKRIT